MDDSAELIKAVKAAFFGNNPFRTCHPNCSEAMAAHARTISALIAMADHLRRRLHKVEENQISDGMAIASLKERVPKVRIEPVRSAPEQEQPQGVCEACDAARMRGFPFCIDCQPVREQPQTEWRFLDDYDGNCAGLGFGGHIVGLDAMDDIATLLNKSGITPDTTNDELAMLKRCLEMRGRGLELVRDDLFTANTHQALMYELLRELLLGEGQ